MREKYATAVDASFHSHLHYDHFSCILAGELLKAGKAVVAPIDVKEACIRWKIDGADKMLTLPQDRKKLAKGIDLLVDKLDDYAVAGARLVNYPGYQYEYRLEIEDDVPVLKRNPVSRDAAMDVNNRWASGVEMYAFAIQLGGLNLLFPAEVLANPSFFPWLISLINTEWQPDVCLCSYHRHEMIKLFDPIIVPLHTLELGHCVLELWLDDPRPQFPCFLYNREGGIDSNELFWGESIYIPKGEPGNEKTVL